MFCLLLGPRGDVVTMECVEKLIKKDMLHPLTGVTLKPADIIPLKMVSLGLVGHACSCACSLTVSLHMRLRLITI